MLTIGTKTEYKDIDAFGKPVIRAYTESIRLPLESLGALLIYLFKWKKHEFYVALANMGIISLDECRSFFFKLKCAFRKLLAKCVYMLRKRCYK